MVRGSNPDKARLSVPDQTSPGTQVVFGAMGAVSFLGIKRPGIGAVHTPASSNDAAKDLIHTPLLYICIGMWWAALKQLDLPDSTIVPIVLCNTVYYAAVLMMND